MMLKDGTEEVEDGTTKTGVVKTQDGPILQLVFPVIVVIWKNSGYNFNSQLILVISTMNNQTINGKTYMVCL